MHILITGAGLDEALDDVNAVVDLSNFTTARYQAAAAFVTTATDHLFAADQRAGVTHHLTLSIVGVDRFPSAHYRAKLDQEAAVTAASTGTGVGHTTVRVPQFHDSAPLVLQRCRLRRLVLAPPLHSQPVHLVDVADHLLGILAGGPAGHAPEIGGPQPLHVPDMVRRYARKVEPSYGCSLHHCSEQRSAPTTPAYFFQPPSAADAPSTSGSPRSNMRRRAEPSRTRTACAYLDYGSGIHLPRPGKWHPTALAADRVAHAQRRRFVLLNAPVGGQSVGCSQLGP